MEETRQMTSCNTNHGSEIRVGKEGGDREKQGSEGMKPVCVVRFWGKEECMFSSRWDGAEGDIKITVQMTRIRIKSTQNHVVKECNSIDSNHFYDFKKTAPFGSTRNGRLLVMIRWGD